MIRKARSTRKTKNRSSPQTARRAENRTSLISAEQPATGSDQRSGLPTSFAGRASFVRRAESIKAECVLQPIHITRDRSIPSRHRRHCAAQVAGFDTVSVIAGHVDSDDERPVQLLIKHNQQRVKGFDEYLRESAITGATDQRPEIALRVNRESQSDTAAAGTVIDGGIYRERSTITAAKLPMLSAVIDVLNSLRNYWPLQCGKFTISFDRPPLIHACKPESTCRNQQKCDK